MLQTAVRVGVWAALQQDGCLRLFINQEAWGTVAKVSWAGGGEGVRAPATPRCEGARFRAGVQLIKHIICTLEGAESAHCWQLF